MRVIFSFLVLYSL